MRRIAKQFERLKEKNQKSFVAYVTAGHPTLAHLPKLITILEDSGVDFIEIGIPYSDPLADGEVIQNAALKALNQQIQVNDIFEVVKDIQKTSSVPLLFLVYFNTVYHYGVKQFIERCVEVGIDGLIIPDLPLEEKEEVLVYTKQFPIDLIPLVAPNSKERIPAILEKGSGFVYCVSSLGVTGVRKGYSEETLAFIKEVKAQSELPVLVGFGISSHEAISQINQVCDGVIVGSYIVDYIEKNSEYLEGLKEEIIRLREGNGRI